MGEVYMWSRGLAGEAVTELANDALNHYQQLGHYFMQHLKNILISVWETYSHQMPPLHSSHVVLGLFEER